MLSCFSWINSYFDQGHVQKQSLKTTHSSIVEQNQKELSNVTPASDEISAKVEKKEKRKKQRKDENSSKKGKKRKE